MFKKSKIFLVIVSCLTISGAYAAQFGAEIEETTEAMRETAQTQPAPQSSNKTAEDMAADFVDNAASTGILEQGEGWNDKQQTYVVVATAEYKADSASPNFVKMRAMKAIEAGLNAKTEIIRFIRTEMSVENIVTMPETGLNTEFDKKLADLQRRLALKTKAYEETLRSVNQLKEENPIDISSLMQEGILEGLKKGGIKVDLNKLSADHAERVKKAEQELVALQKEIDEVKAEAEKLRGSLRQENTSKIESLAAMPLVGAATIGQWESFVDGTYQLSVVMTWSPRQERFAKAMLEGEKLEIEQKGPMSLGQYIRNNDWSTAIGGRKFLDDQGNYSLIGIGSWPILGKGSAARREAEGHARLLATSNIAMNLVGDVRVKEIAQTKAQELAGGVAGPETQVVSNMAQTLSESVNRLQLQGLERRFGRKMTHPISGQEMYVAVYSYGVQQSQVAKKIEKSNYAATESIERANDRSLGVKDGLNKSFQKAADDPRNYQSGYSEGLKHNDPKQKAKSEKKVQTDSTQKAQAGGQRQVQGAGTNAGAFLY